MARPSTYLHTFTIFTPTFNRADTLPRVYSSILEQTFTDFEWLIIDDGSEDNTKELVESWISEGKFPIRYFYQENTHKFFTILKAAKLAKGELLYVFDSDDKMLPHTLHTLYSKWLSIPEGDRSNFSGATGLCQNQHGEIVGMQYPTDPFDSDSLESYYRYGIRGEKSGFQRTELIKSLEFEDSFFGNGYVPESILWISLANKGYKTRYFNDVVRIYFEDEGPSISTDLNFKKNSFGAFQQAKLVLDLSAKYWFYNPKAMLLAVRSYVSNGLFQKMPWSAILRNVDNPINRVLVICFAPLGILFYNKHK